VTPSETVILTRYVKALCPAQAIDEYTPDAWHDVLGGYSLAECRAAAATAATTSAFVAPAEIIAEVKRSRRAVGERVRSERILAPARAVRSQLDDPRPLRETIRAIVSRYGRAELEAP
jgi:hypothetical protein